MKDPLSGCAYNLLYQELKRFSRNGEYFCKELMTIFQQRSELEISYAKGMQKLAGRLIRASKGTDRSSSTYNAWCQVSNEMYAIADVHRALGNAFHQEAVVELRQALDEHNKRKRPLDTAVEKVGKRFIANWNEQLKVKKKLIGLTREHEALFSFVENNKNICTEKEKQKMLNRLTKSAELQARVDEEYFSINVEALQVRVKWENTLKSCYQIIQEVEKHRIETLFSILSKYGLHMSNFGQTLTHRSLWYLGQCQNNINQVIRTADMEGDIAALVEETSVTAVDNKAEFLIADYFEEDRKTVMGPERRRDAVTAKLQRLESHIAKTRKDHEGLEKILKTSSENPSAKDDLSTEESEQLLDETTLKLDLLEVTHCKLSAVIAELEGKPKHLHRFSDSVTKWKDKDCEHSTVQLPRPVKTKKRPLRSRQATRRSVMYKGPVKNGPSEEAQPPGDPGPARRRADTNSSVGSDEGEAEDMASVGRCRALYDFTSERDDELRMKEGDTIDIFQKGDDGWWFGALNGQRGHFPSTYVEELPVFTVTESSNA
ncbi:nostrin isoform X1 [Denticeps clupeoides]|uniref:nostrin isoform X1 n=1 Tax=Denticeps clupeoides TaxID=299321 RepID=UPI0010A2F71A|nr:nostrin isoform X1 [Denticeps clupeoides]